MNIRIKYLGANFGIDWWLEYENHAVLIMTLKNQKLLNGNETFAMAA